MTPGDDLEARQLERLADQARELTDAALLEARWDAAERFATYAAPTPALLAATQSPRMVDPALARRRREAARRAFNALELELATRRALSGRELPRRA